MEEEKIHPGVPGRNITEGMRVIDVGCGTGRHLLLLRDRLRLGVGVDYEHSYIAEANRRAGGRYLHFVTADATAIPVLTAFDFAMCLTNTWGTMGEWLQASHAGPVGLFGGLSVVPSRMVSPRLAAHFQSVRRLEELPLLWRIHVMSQPRKFATIDEYIATVSPDARRILEEIRKIVKRKVPDAEETISYQMPAFKLDRIFIYFAAFKKHIGIYPPVKGDKALAKALLPYRGERGNLKFPLDQPMPYDLIGRVVVALSRQSAKGAAA